MIQTLGKIAITPKGQYVTGSYERLDLVTDNGSSYLSLKDNNVSYLTVKADWMVVAEKGKAFEYSDFTPEQIAELQKPASDIATTVSNAEGLRVTAETNRNNAEVLRLSAEIIRNENEADRIEAEGLRVGAETSRQTAEGLRQQAELNRQTNTSTAISNAEIATDDANDAALLANEKAGLANEKAGLANEKAGLAATATTQANAARDGANSAAQSATNLVNSYATDLAAKELKDNKQNSLEVDGTGTKFPTVDAVNGNFATQVEAEANTENTKFMNALRVFQNFVKNATTYVFTTLNTTSKTIIGAINELFANKADKAQEAWITPTLLNGFTGNVSYMKDNFGFVHIRGEVNNTAGVAPLNIFTLPLGYTPIIQPFRFTTVGGEFRNTAVFLAITVPGDVQVNVGSPIGYISLDCVTFKV